jgi:DHA2 family multidrug resistance protein
MPLVGQPTSRVQARYLLATGWAGLLIGMYVSSHWVNLYVSFGSATWVRILQFIPLGFVFVPLNVAGYIGLGPEKTNAAAGLMNFTRNIGQSVGTSAVTTLIVRRSQYHQSVLAEHSASGGFDAAIQSLTTQLAQAGMSVYDAGQQALGRMYGIVRAQAATLAYVDVFWLLAAFSVLMLFGSFLLKANKPGGGANVSVH